MLEADLLAGAGSAGLAALAAPRLRILVRGPGLPAWTRAPLARYRARADHARLPFLTPYRLLAFEAGLSLGAFWAVFELSRIVALAVGAAAGALAVESAVLATRWSRHRAALEDAILESARLMRQMLTAGGASVVETVEALAQRGPVELRHEFGRISAGSLTGSASREWKAARDRLEEPGFDLLAAAVSLQRPSGGELGPVLRDLEVALAARLAVSREAYALQAQARGAAAMIVGLPYFFILGLALVHSPYLASYRSPAGEIVVGSVLGIMALSRAWIARLLALPAEPRLEVALD